MFIAKIIDIRSRLEPTMKIDKATLPHHNRNLPNPTEGDEAQQSPLTEGGERGGVLMIP